MATTPVIEDTREGTGSGGLPLTVTMPPGTVSSDLCLLVWAVDGTGDSVSIDAGAWTTNTLRNSAATTTSAHSSLISWNTGLTASSTVDVTCNDGAEAWHYKVFRISNWDSASDPEISNAFESNLDDIFDGSPTGTPTITPSWGSDTIESLVLWITTGDQTNWGVLTYPTEFPDNRQSGTGAADVQIFHGSDDTLQASWTPAEVVGGYSSNTGHTECIVAIRGATAAATDVTGTFSNKFGNPQAGLSGLNWAWFDENIGALTAPTATGGVATSGLDGTFTIDVTGTSLTAGQTGTLVIYDSTGEKYGAYRAIIGANGTIRLDAPGLASSYYLDGQAATIGQILTPPMGPWR